MTKAEKAPNINKKWITLFNVGLVQEHQKGNVAIIDSRWNVYNNVKQLTVKEAANARAQGEI